MREIAHVRLRLLLRYDEITGEFTRLQSTSSNAKAGDIAGCANGKGYIDIFVDGRSYRAHRLAWFYVTGSWPDGLIDHADGDRSNNRFSNLRLATNSQNCANAKLRRDNGTGAKGVRRMNGRWQVRIGSGGRKHVGTYDTMEDAQAAYEHAALNLYGTFARAK